MNTRSFVSQSKKPSRASNSNRTTAQSRASHPQKRWQSKSKKVNQSTVSKPSPRLSPAEQDMLTRQQALSLAQHGNREQSIALFNELLSRNASSAIDYSNRGLVHFQNGQLSEALADYNQAIELNPRLDSAYNNRANYYATQGQYLEAILDYDIALDLNPANIRAWINQGITFRELEMYDRAIESFDLALCLGRLEGHIYAERGRAYQLRGDWNCAVADYCKAQEKLPQGAESLSGSSARLRTQVKEWFNDLLSLTFEEDDTWKL